MDWSEATARYDEMTFEHDGRLTSLPEQWQRELAALWRVEANVNNGGYLQFLVNCGRESYEYASRGLKRIGALQMARIIDECQALVDEHFDSKGKTQEQLVALMPNQCIDRDGKVTKDNGSVLPEPIVERIYELSYEFMDYPDDILELGTRYYGHFVDSDTGPRTAPADRSLLGLDESHSFFQKFGLFLSAVFFGPLIAGFVFLGIQSLEQPWRAVAIWIAETLAVFWALLLIFIWWRPPWFRSIYLFVERKVVTVIGIIGWNIVIWFVIIIFFGWLRAMNFL